MPLADEDAGMVHGLGKAQLEDQGLQAAFQEVLGGERKHVIQLVLRLLQQSVLVHAPQQRLSLKQPLRLLVIQRQQRPGSLQRSPCTPLSITPTSLIIRADLAGPCCKVSSNAYGLLFPSCADRKMHAGAGAVACTELLSKH